MKIEDVVLYKGSHDSDYELNFSIRNVKSPLKVNGHIWAVATFVTTGGEKFFVGAPEKVKVARRPIQCCLQGLLAPLDINSPKGKARRTCKEQTVAERTGRNSYSSNFVI